MKKICSIVFFALCVLSAACGSNNSSESSLVRQKSNDSPRQVSLLLNWFPEAEHGGFYAAKIHGYYKEVGLDVQIIAGGPGAAVVPRIATKKAAFGVTNADRVLFGSAQKAGVVAVMAAMQKSPRCIMVHESSGIRSLKQIRNMTLAMSTKAAFSHFMRKKVRLRGVDIVPYPGNVKRFLMDENFAQQAYVISEPYVAKTMGGDPVSLLVADELDFNPYTSLVVTHEGTVANAPQLVRDFVAASIKGWQHYLKDATETNQHIHSLNPGMELAVLEFGAREIAPLVLDGLEKSSEIGKMTEERWLKLLGQLVESGQIEKDAVDISSTFITSFLPNDKIQSE